MPNLPSVKKTEVISPPINTSFHFILASGNIASVYGAAGSIMIIMVWVYYSSIILYLGAEFTKVYAKLYGGKIYPNEYAIWIKTEETQVANPVLKNKVLD